MDLLDLDPITMLSAGAAFTLVIALWGVATIALVRRRSMRSERIRQRIDPVLAPVDSSRTLRLWHEGGESTLVVAGEPGPSSLFERINWIFRDAGYELPAGLILLLLGTSFVALAAVLFVITGQLVTGLGAGSAIVVLFWFNLTRRISKRTAQFEQQLVDGLELSSRALRAGHPMLGSFQLIAEEVPEPVGRIFADICQKHQMGISLENALTRAADLSRSQDMRLFSASLAIQIHTGGNLADVVEGIAKVIRQRMRLSRRFRVLTAQTQMSKRILLGLPVVMFGAMQVISPSYMTPLFDTRPGNILLAIATSGLLIGWFVMNKMATLQH